MSGRMEVGSVLVSAVVINLNQRDLLYTCLSSLRQALHFVGDGQQMIVVDNGSQDGSVAMVRADFPEALLIELESNSGFTGGLTAGIRSATGEWILCVNNDATVAPDAIVELLRVADMEGERLGSVAALMVFADRPDVINSAGIVVDRLGIASDRLLGEPVASSESEPVEVFGASAGAALYRRAMLEQVPFEPSFFAYYEDVDVAWRARMNGWRAVYAPRAVVKHHHSATARHGSAFKYYWSGRNRIRVLARNATGSQLRRYALAMVVFDLAYVAFALVRDRSVMPLRGRVGGLRIWRSDRLAGATSRNAVDLEPFLGLRAALRRARGGR